MAAVEPPQSRRIGVLKTGGYEFHFTGDHPKPVRGAYGHEIFLQPGKLIGIGKLSPWEGFQDQRRFFLESFFSLQSQIDTNGAYRLATQWLAAISVDVRALEKVHQPIITQAEFMVSGKKRQAPVFNVTWGSPMFREPAVAMQIFGPNRELVSLAFMDTRFLNRKRISLKTP